MPGEEDSDVSDALAAIEDENTDKLSDEETIRKLKCQVKQLRNIILKLTGQKDGRENDSGHRKSSKRKKTFDFSSYDKRHVLLHVSYAGWDLHGFAVQEISGKTVESELFRALTTTRLIESRETSNYHRCGRTDRGVSAFNQVISIDVRSNLGTGDRDHGPREIDYCKILNANLPREIQIISWAACPFPDYSARFNCVKRTYKYFFPLGSINLNLINEAGNFLIGEHDFRNFCKMDVAHGVTEYTRNIFNAEATLMNPEVPGNPYSMCVLTISGKAFLWHQIRCIVAVLFRVGEGKEHPDVVKTLLDVQNNPRRPQYQMASEIPLNLFEVEYDEEIKWNFDQEALGQAVAQYQGLWADHAIKAAMMRESLREMEKKLDTVPSMQNEGVVPLHKKNKEYTPLMNMQLCPSLEEKLEAPSARRAVKRPKLNEDA